MIPSTVTDEVTPDRTTHAFPKIFTMAADQGIRTFEVRMVEAKRFPVVEASAWDRMWSMSSFSTLMRAASMRARTAFRPTCRDQPPLLAPPWGLRHPVAQAATRADRPPAHARTARRSG